MAVHTHIRAVTKPSASPAGRLQRACACGQHTGSGGECAECRRKREATLQRAAVNSAPVSEVPPIVHDALRSPGQPLDPATRAFMEPRFGHDFSRVRVHADARAADSARAVNALAYTVGHDVVFGAEQFAPGTSAGQRLLAHELTHVVQQSEPVQTASQGQAGEQLEGEAERAAQQVGQGHAVRVGASGEAGTLLKAPQKPGASQKGKPSKEEKMIADARGEAYIRTFRAYEKVVGLGPPPPPGREDSAVIEKMRIRSLARRMFDWPNPNMEQIGDILGDMRGHLSASSSEAVQASAKDPNCGNRAGYVVGRRPPVYLCPPFFSGSPEQRARTLIHEAAHLSGIGEPSGESYCVIFDCENSCGGFEAADSWAHFVHCVIEKPADQPEVIEGKRKP